MVPTVGTEGSPEPCEVEEDGAVWGGGGFGVGMQTLEGVGMHTQCRRK